MRTYLVAYDHTYIAPGCMLTTDLGFVVSWDGSKLELVPYTAENAEVVSQQGTGKVINCRFKRRVAGAGLMVKVRDFTGKSEMERSVK